MSILLKINKAMYTIFNLIVTSKLNPRRVHMLTHQRFSYVGKKKTINVIIIPQGKINMQLKHSLLSFRQSYSYIVQVRLLMVSGNGEISSIFMKSWKLLVVPSSSDMFHVLILLSLFNHMCLSPTILSALLSYDVISST